MGEGRNAENGAGEDKLREKVGKKNEQRKSVGVWKKSKELHEEKQKTAAGVHCQ